MANREQLDLLVGKTMLNVGFRDRLLGDPEGAAESIGVCLTEAQANRIRQWDLDVLDALAGAFEDWLVPLRTG